MFLAPDTVLLEQAPRICAHTHTHTTGYPDILSRSNSMNPDILSQSSQFSVKSSAVVSGKQLVISETLFVGSLAASRMYTVKFM